MTSFNLEVTFEKTKFEETYQRRFGARQAPNWDYLCNFEQKFFQK